MKNSYHHVLLLYRFSKCVPTSCILNTSHPGAIHSTGAEQELMFMQWNIPRIIKLLTFSYHNFEPFTRDLLRENLSGLCADFCTFYLTLQCCVNVFLSCEQPINRDQITSWINLSAQSKPAGNKTYVAEASIRTVLILSECGLFFSHQTVSDSLTVGALCHMNSAWRIRQMLVNMNLCSYE